MSDVERYTPYAHPCDYRVMEPDPKGDWVDYEEYNQMRERYDSLLEEYKTYVLGGTDDY